MKLGKYFKTRQDNKFKMAKKVYNHGNATEAVFTNLNDNLIMKIENGSAAAPALAFTSDPDSGIYRLGSNIFGISVAGTEVARFGTALVQFTATDASFTGQLTSVGNLYANSRVFLALGGSAASPTLTFNGDFNTGIYRNAADVIGVSVAGADAIVIDSDASTFTGAVSFNETAPYATPANTGALFVGDGTGGTTANELYYRYESSGSLIELSTLAAPAASMSNGTEALPGWAFTSDPDTGLYRIAANDMGISVGGSKTLRIFTDGIEIPQGNSANPSLTFDSSNVGISANINDLSVNVSALEYFRVSTTGVFTVVGSAASPSYAFFTDSDTGMYRTAANTIGFSTGGVNRLEVSSAGIVMNAGGTINGVDLTSAGGGTLYLSDDGTYSAPGGGGSSSMADGTEALPGWAFTSDTDTGFYRIGADDMATSVGGAKILRIFTDGIEIPQGNSANPSLTFDSSNVGISANINDLSVNISAAEYFRISTTGVFTVVGSESAPSYAFFTDSDTGMYRSAANTITFVTNGTDRVTIDSNGITMDNGGTVNGVPLTSGGAGTTFLASDGTYKSISASSMPDGTEAVPGLAFASDGDTGFYRLFANDLGISTAGTRRLRINSSAVTCETVLGIQNGTPANPSLTFDSDTDTGIYRIGANIIGISSGGNEKLRVEAGLIDCSVPVKFPSGTGELSYYQSGTFTPTLTGGTDAGTPTYTTQSGVYERIGDTVNFKLEIEVGSGDLDTWAGDVRVGALPYTSANDSIDCSVSISNFQGADIGTDLALGAEVIANTTYIEFAKIALDGAGSTTKLDAADVDDTGKAVIIRIAGKYFV